MKTISWVNKDGTRELWGVVSDAIVNPMPPIIDQLRRTNDQRFIIIEPFVERGTKDTVSAARETVPEQRE